MPMFDGTPDNSSWPGSEALLGRLDRTPLDAFAKYFSVRLWSLTLSARSTTSDWSAPTFVDVFKPPILFSASSVSAFSLSSRS